MLKQKTVDVLCAEVAAVLRAERERQKLSMNTVAAQGGLSQQMVSYVERGMRTPTLDTLVRITHSLEIDLADVLQRAQRAAHAKTK